LHDCDADHGPGHARSAEPCRKPADRNRHEELGFFDGWGTVLDQLVAHAKTM